MEDECPSAEEDEDFEYVNYSLPAHRPEIGLPLRKSIMVGGAYQAQIPEMKKDDPKRKFGDEKPLWRPCPRLSDHALEEYLATVKRMHLERASGVAALPRGTHTPDDEEALTTLRQCGYSVERALRRLGEHQTGIKDWVEDECRKFESGIRLYGKDFFAIRGTKVKARTVGELVRFYYLWKKSERHDVFSYRAKMQKRKYALHPGVTFYEDGQNIAAGKEASLTNTQCLVYGEPPAKLPEQKDEENRVSTSTG